MREARALADRGVKELLLISQDTTFYGNDLGERGALSRLLRQLDKVDGLEWIRLLYLYPTTIDDAMLDAMAESDKVCKSIDLPLQHASDAMLKRMRRPGKSQLRTITRSHPHEDARRRAAHHLHCRLPRGDRRRRRGASAFVSSVQFDHIGVFTYSHEEGTRAGEWNDDVPAASKRKRRDRLMAQQRTIVSAAQQRRIGSRVRLVVDGPSPEHELVLRGRLASQAPEIDPVVYLTDCDPTEVSAGQFLDGEVAGARE